jgi:multidrug transporter EmrE-like cation transporter
MLFLVVHLIGNAAFTLLVRYARGPRFDYATVGTTNYVTGAVLAIAVFVATGAVAPSWASLVAGAVNGAQYQLTFLLMHALIGVGGIAVATSILRLAAAVPVVASVVIWHEGVSIAQATGLAIAAVALPLLAGVNPTIRGRDDAVAHPGTVRVAVTLVTTLLVTGAGLLAAKVFAELSIPDDRPAYVAAAYATATVFSAVTWRRQPRGDGRLTATGRARSIGLGVVTGAVNFGQLSAFLPALASVPGVIAFPIAAAGGLLCTLVGGWAFFRERLTVRHSAGLVLAICAATLMNWGG